MYFSRTIFFLLLVQFYVFLLLYKFQQLIKMFLKQKKQVFHILYKLRFLYKFE